MGSNTEVETRMIQPKRGGLIEISKEMVIRRFQDAIQGREVIGIWYNNDLDSLLVKVTDPNCEIVWEAMPYPRIAVLDVWWERNRVEVEGGLGI